MLQLSNASINKTPRLPSRFLLQDFTSLIDSTITGYFKYLHDDIIFYVYGNCGPHPLAESFGHDFTLYFGEGIHCVFHV